MVSTQFTTLTKAQTCRPFKNPLPFSDSPPDAVPSDSVELDFSDVFGPVSVPDGNLETGDSGERVFDDPVVIFKRSHSLVGPSACVSHSLKLNKLTLHEAEALEEEYIIGKTAEDLSECSSDDDVKTSQHGEISTKERKVGLEDFEIMKVVGKGAFGKVYQVKKKGTFEIYAMKVMRKDKIVEGNHAEYMKAERDILTKIDHPFIVQLRYSFQTKYRLYLVLDFVNGGHLFFQLYNHGLFREDLARIYSAEIVSAVSHLHVNAIMHRDLKPENILLDADGHVVLTDFGLAKQFQENERCNSLCGTVEYMAPEIIAGKGHDKAADWWSVGVLIFEMLTGKPPFVGGGRDKIQQKIMKDKMKLPAFLTSEAHSLLKGLLNKEPSKRLGCGPTGVEEIRHHKWFKSIIWKRLEERQVQPSFRPEVSGAQCIANFDKCWTDMPVVDSPAASPRAEGDLLFKDFTYVKPAGSFLQVASSLNEDA